MNCSCTRRANSSAPANANKVAHPAWDRRETWRRGRKRPRWQFSIGCVRNGGVYRPVFEDFSAQADTPASIGCGAAARATCRGFAVATSWRGYRHEQIRAARPGAQLVFVAGILRDLRYQPRTPVAWAG